MLPAPLNVPTTPTPQKHVGRGRYHIAVLSKEGYGRFVLSIFTGVPVTLQVGDDLSQPRSGNHRLWFSNFQRPPRDQPWRKCTAVGECVPAPSPARRLVLLPLTLSSFSFTPFLLLAVIRRSMVGGLDWAWRATSHIFKTFVWAQEAEICKPCRCGDAG